MTVTLVAYGDPAPQGSKKFVGRTATGRGIITETSSKTQPWRADVKAAAEKYMDQHCDFEPFEAGVEVCMVFTFLRPPSVKRIKRPFPSVPPDLGKLARSTEDAITASGLWKDDKLVVEYRRLAKVYAGEDPDSLQRAGCLIRIDSKPIRAIGIPEYFRLVYELEQGKP